MERKKYSSNYKRAGREVTSSKPHKKAEKKYNKHGIEIIGMNKERERKYAAPNETYRS